MEDIHKRVKAHTENAVAALEERYKPRTVEHRSAEAMAVVGSVVRDRLERVELESRLISIVNGALRQEEEHTENVKPAKPKKQRPAPIQARLDEFASRHIQPKTANDVEEEEGFETWQWSPPSYAASQDPSYQRIPLTEARSSARSAVEDSCTCD